METVTVRHITPKDVEAVLAVERLVHGGTTWTEQSLSRFLDRRCGAGLLAEHSGGTPLGHLLFEVNWPGQTVSVRRATERPGGSRYTTLELLLRRLVRLTEFFQGFTAYFPVREQDLRMHLLLTSLGFKSVGVHRNWYLFRYKFEFLPPAVDGETADEAWTFDDLDF